MRDFDIRTLLKNTKLLKYTTDGESKVVDEMRLPAAYARIDLAVINGHFHGFEIKSAVDTLQRLPGQIEAYTKVFDYLYVVTEDKHCNKVMEALPDWVGVYLCQEKKGCSYIKQVRKAKKNKAKDGFYIAKLLWRNELVDILEEYQIPFKKKERNWILCETLSSSFDVEALSKIVREKLKVRPHTEFTRDYVEL